jgi:hypothetical protein
MKRNQKNQYYRFLLECLAVILLVTITGCGKNSASTGKNKSPKIPIKIEDIAWSVEEGIIDGDRGVFFEYTNNTNNVITYLKIEFKQKSNISKKERSILEAYKEKYEEYGIDDSKITDLSIHITNEEMLNPGQSSKKEPLIYSYLGRVESIEEYQIMQPEIMTIEYIDKDNKICKVYYDFKNKEYSKDSAAPKDLFEWDDNEFTQLLPYPNFDRMEIASNTSEDFWFEMYGATPEQCKSYIEECKAKGFTISADYFDGYYNAKNQDGYELTVEMNDGRKSIAVMLNKPHDMK